MADINIKAQDEILRGQYANMMQVSHSHEEFVLDFILSFPPQGELVSRLIVSPAHMKRIVNALMDNVRRYESQFGAIQEAGEPKMLNG
jgi:hypothetical protein